MKTKLFFLLLFLNLLFSGSYSQHSAKLDSSFHSDGEFILSYLSNYQSVVAAETLPDSSLIFSSANTAGLSPTSIIKLKFDGTIDSTFAANGKLTYSLGGTAVSVYEIDYYKGNLFLSGKANRDKFVTKIDVNGKIDSTFGTNGSTLINYGTPIVSSTNSYGIDSSGNIYIGARITILSSSITEIVITKIFGNTGLIDNTFGTSGHARYSISTGALSSLSDIIVDSSQHIIASCCGSNTTNNVVYLVSFNPNGTLNTSFNSSGHVEYTFPSADTYQVSKNKMEVDGDKIIVIGDYIETLNYYVFALKVKPNGSLDSNFATNGKLKYTNGATTFTHTSNGKLDDGRLLISGAAALTPNSYYSFIMLNKDGSIDSSFSQNGAFIDQIGTRWETNGADCMAIYPNSTRFFAGGNSSDCDGATCYYSSSMLRIRIDSLQITKDTTGHGVSISELDSKNQVSIYPNPIKSGNSIHIKTEVKVTKVVILSVNGSLVFESKLNSKSFQIPNSIQKGIYILQMYTDESIMTHKLSIE